MKESDETSTTNRCSDLADALGQVSRRNDNQVEAEAPVRFFMYPLKTQGVFEADPPRLARCHEAEILDKEDTLLEYRFRLDALQFARQGRRERVPQINGQRSRTHD